MKNNGHLLVFKVLVWTFLFSFWIAGNPDWCCASSLSPLSFHDASRSGKPLNIWERRFLCKSNALIVEHIILKYCVSYREKIKRRKNNFGLFLVTFG
jgi:hypothetical protein